MKKLVWICTLHTVQVSLGIIFTYQTNLDKISSSQFERHTRKPFMLIPLTSLLSLTGKSVLSHLRTRLKKGAEGWGVHNTNSHACTSVSSQSPCQRGCRCHGNTKTCFSARVTIATGPINGRDIVTIRPWCLWPVQRTWMVTYNTTFYFVRNIKPE